MRLLSIAAAMVALTLSGEGVSAFVPTSRPNAPFRTLASRRFVSTTTPTKEPMTLPTDQQQIDEDDSMSTKSWTDDGFVFGLEGSGLQRPTGRNSLIAVEGDSLETTPFQVGLVTATLTGHALYQLYALQEMVALNSGNVMLTALQAVGLTVASWILADFGSGVLHWSVDNYGNGKTPIMGGIIAAFQGHHTAPWTITQRGFCNNVYKLCLPFGLVPMTLFNALTGPFTTLFLSTFCVFEILSQEFHKWSHQLPREAGSVANWMQRQGLSVNRKQHALHHLAPFEGNYCIISGVCNPFLDQSGFFRWLEHTVYRLNGVESNAWKLDPELKARTLAGDYRFVEQKAAR